MQLLQVSDARVAELRLQPVMTVNLRRFSLVPPAEREALLDVLRDSYDTPVSGSDTFDGCLEYLLTKPGFWAIYVGGAPVGLFALGPTKEFEHLQTTTIIAPEYRGTGLNAPLKRAVAEAMRDAGVSLASSVRLWNERSIRAMRRAFPEVTPVEVFIPLALGKDAGIAEPSLFFDLSDLPMTFVEWAYTPVYETILLWAKAKVLSVRPVAA